MVNECSMCKTNLPERELELSHDIPRYLGGTDLDGRRYLCKKCHNKYELYVLKNVYEMIFQKKLVLNKEGERVKYMKIIKKYIEKDPGIIENIKCYVRWLRNEFFLKGGVENDSKTASE